MVNINRQIVLEGVRADFCTVDQLSQRLVTARASRSRRVQDTKRYGMRRRNLRQRLKWLKTSGIVTPDKWGDLPGGGVTAHHEHQRHVVVDGVVGDYFCANASAISNPIRSRIEVENNRIRSLAPRTRICATNFALTPSTDENSNRVGEFQSSRHQHRLHAYHSAHVPG